MSKEPELNRAEERRWGRKPPLRHGKFLRAARESTGKTAKEVCRETGMSVAQLSDVERGIGPLSLKRARQLSKVLRQPFHEIVQAILQDHVEDAGFNFEVMVGMPDQLNVLVGGMHGKVGNEDSGCDSQSGARGSRSMAR